MNWPDIFLLCFGVGSLWSFIALLLGGIHLGHSLGAQGAGHAHAGGDGGYHLGAHHAVGDHSAGHHSAGYHGGAHHGGGPGDGQSASAEQLASWIGTMLNPSCLAIFLAWFGGIGYLLTRHSDFGLYVDL